MLRTMLLLTLAGLTASAQAQPAPVQPATGRAARIEELIRQLGDESFEKRESATKALLEIGSPARLALEKATKSTDAETALRATTILERLPKFTHTLVDAVGQPIPLATVALFSAARQPSAELPPPAEATPTGTVVTDEDGRLAVPEVEAQDLQHSARVEHPDYGIARGLVPLEKDTLLRVPLVKRGSEAHARALSGQLVTQSGEPIAGASIRCDNVRTPGEGLIEPLYPRGELLTDDQGRFACYLPSENRNRQRGELIPPGSRYSVTITVPDDDAYLPTARYLANA